MWTRPATRPCLLLPKALELSWRPLCNPGQRLDGKEERGPCKDKDPVLILLLGTHPQEESRPCPGCHFMLWGPPLPPLPSPMLSPHPGVRALVNLQKSVLFIKLLLLLLAYESILQALIKEGSRKPGREGRRGLGSTGTSSPAGGPSCVSL